MHSLHKVHKLTLNKKVVSEYFVSETTERMLISWNKRCQANLLLVRLVQYNLLLLSVAEIET